jgi:acyl carrier protein
MKKILIVLSIFSSIYFITGCDQSVKPATGFEDEIYVVADSLEFEELKVALQSAFEVEINTPLPEKLFTLKRISSNLIDKVKNKKNIVIVAPLNSGSYTSQFIKSIVDKELQKRLETSEDFIISKYDLWAKNQLVTVLSAANMQELEFKILRNKDNLLYEYQKISDKRLKESLYAPRYERKAIEGLLLRNYGWLIYVQADYKLAKSDSVNKFVWLRRSPGSDMERWIFIHWIDNATPEYLNADSIKAIRNRMTKEYYQVREDTAYVVLVDSFCTTSEVNFNNRYALYTQGLWDLNIKGMGGPFVNYTFYDEKSKRLYMLDGSIYAPKYYKRNLIQQIDVILQSFLTKDEVSKDRAEDLIDDIDESIKY